MNKSNSLISKHPVLLFFLLTYLLSWWSAPLANGQIIPHGPAIAALAVVGINAGRQGLRELWHRITLWRVYWIWFAIGPGVILGYHGIAFMINLLLGANVSNPPSISSGTFLELLLLGGLWEEPGWSGYALPKLQKKFANRPNGILIAALVLGVFGGLWHLPLFIYGHLPWFDIFVFNFAFQLIIAWVFYRSGGSVLAVMVLHFSSNLMGSLTYPVFTGTAHTTYTALFMAVASLIALLLIWKSLFKLGRNTTEQLI